MKRFKVGVLTNSLRLSPRDAISKAAELGADGFQIYTTGGEMDPDKMDKGQRADFKKFVADSGIELASLCGDIGAYSDSAANPERIPIEKKILELAADLGTGIVTSHIGVVPDDPEDAAFKTLHTALHEISEHAASVGVKFAIETGPEKAAILKKLLDAVNSPGLAVNLDPANLVMCVSDDPAAAVRVLKDYIVSTHAKDGMLPDPNNPGYKEVPLGEGDVNWDEYLGALEEIGFDGYLTIEREVGDDPATDIAAAIGFLRGKMA